MNKTFRGIMTVLLVVLLASCGSEQSGQSSAQSYKDIKTIVLDILKTEDAQKTIQETQAKSQDKTTKLLSTGDGQQIQLAVKDILTAPGSDKLLQKTMTDPRFAGEFAKATQGSMKQLHKDLMKDPEYQQAMIQVMSNPEFEKMVLQVMKSAAYRQQTMSIMTESLQSPLFRVQLIDMLKKVVEEETKPGGQAGQLQGGGTSQSKSEGKGKEQGGGGDKKQGGGDSSDSGDSGDGGDDGDESGKKQKK